MQLSERHVLETLREGAMEEKGLLPYSSNHSFLVVITHGDLALPAVYKPQRGESPLWDFEWGTLCKRETAAYVVSTHLNWHLVPPTVLRGGTRGLGSVQFYVHNDTDEHYFTVQEDARFVTSLRQIALFDSVINNADRKSGHCLVGSDARIWAIDHGICFHVEHKLRTVVWEFSGQAIEADLMADLEELYTGLCRVGSVVRTELVSLLAPDEITAMEERLERLLRCGVYPEPSPFRRNYPWPPV